MPELPEADASRRAVHENCLNRTIEEAALGQDTQYVDLPAKKDRMRLEGHQFTTTRRHGKLIFAGSKTGPWMVVHLGMTGRLIPFDAPDDPPKYTKFLLRFEGDRRLAFRCPRKLGWVNIIEDPDDWLAAEGWGPDALALSGDEFRSVIGSSRGALKSALMAQKKLAGIGNLWSDEILFQTGLDPEVSGTDLDEATLDRVFAAMHDVLEGVLATNADYSKLPRDWLIAGREEGGDCPRCGGTIGKRKVGGRTAYSCAKHQGR